MFAAPVLLLALVAADGTADLGAGVARYKAGDNQGALVLLLSALDAKTTRGERGLARLYIGLIQHEAGSVKDAESSFELALRLDARVRLPARASRAARSLFYGVRTRLGLDPKPKVRRNRRRTPRPPPPDPNVLRPLDSKQRAALSSSQSNARIPPAPPPGPDMASSIRTTPAVEDSIATSTWIVAGAGAAAVAAGVTLSILSNTTDDRAYAELDPQNANDLHGRAKTFHAASVVSFVASGLLFGAAAATLAF